MIYVHLVPERSDSAHDLDAACWCEPGLSDGEWLDEPAVLVDHRLPEGEGPHDVFLVGGGEHPLERAP